MKLVPAGFGLILVCASASAHHARVSFSEEMMEIQGELRSLSWSNPHPKMTLSVADSSGQETEWRIEVGGSLFPLRRQGVTSDLFEIGQKVRVAGLVSRRADNELLGTNLLLPDGRELLLRVGDNAVPYFEGDRVVGADWREHVSTVDARAENLGVFRVWSPPAGPAEIRQHSPFTRDAIEARSDWDSVDNFIMRCEMPGMPFVMKTPHPYELIDNGDEILLRGETWDMERTIHMSGESSDVAPNRLGYSEGRWEGDSLVVRTTQINWPYFDQLGTPQSADVEMVERFTISEDQARLSYHLTVVDPATFTAPATYERYWEALGDELPTYDCRVF